MVEIRWGIRTVTEMCSANKSLPRTLIIGEELAMALYLKEYTIAEAGRSRSP